MLSVKATIRQKYDLEGQKYGSPIDRYMYHRWAWEKASRKALKLLEERLRFHDHRVLLLDAGCGNGRWSQLYAGRGFDVVGVDFASGMLEAAIERAKLQNYSDRFLCLLAELENLSMFRDDTFDVAHLFGVIEHLPNPYKVLRELSRVVKPDGLLLLDCPIRYSLSHVTLGLFGSHPFYKFYSSSFVEDLVDGIYSLEIERKEPTIYIWTGGLANWFLTYLSEKLDVSFLDGLNDMVRLTYRRPCGILYVIRKKR